MDRREATAGGGAILRPASPYIVSARYDWLLFLAPPLLALGVGGLVSGTAFADDPVDFHGWETTASTIVLGVIVHAHLFAVFFRSHGNASIFSAHPLRFTVIPVLLYAAMMGSPWIFIAVSVTATFWDVYHSGMQTFGFGRIYDGKVGNDPLLGRKLDWALNLVLYIGPIVGGAAMMDHFGDFAEFEDVDDVFFTQIPAFMEGIAGTLSWITVAGGGLFLLFYVNAYWRYWEEGKQISWLKVWLYVSTGVTSLLAWGFNAFGEAFLIMNLFHAVQYFGIVWAREGKQIANRFKFSGRAWGGPAALLTFLMLCGAYGYWAEAVDTDIRSLWALSLVVSILHFWYDGFIWSVRRKEV
jgi:hypothetical protein